MPSATADTNIYVSALQFGALPQHFLDLAAAGEFRLDISDAILNESLRVLRDKFHWQEADLRDAELTLRACTLHVTPQETLDIIQADPSDNRILECAATAQSDYIITGDKRHILPLGSYRGIPIIQVAEFLGTFKSDPAAGARFAFRVSRNFQVAAVNTSGPIHSSLRLMHLVPLTRCLILGGSL